MLVVYAVMLTFAETKERLAIIAATKVMTEFWAMVDFMKRQNVILHIEQLAMVLLELSYSLTCQFFLCYFYCNTLYYITNETSDGWSEYQIS